ncbi:beta/gamma crystallin-related protein [Brevundimonas lenta]|uniref:Beta/gamma crystallin 'Greek key' domain-containing protein n=1 Tax=Brevundimonas lenta TaxID=424796 RepID=A0A7W6JBM4_9CAUL|nr:beta/gamma crystallin-related protein [Brevundimonas lenta]MBB4082072.1 hypothetical protein [Brevundimonas lenta]
MRSISAVLVAALIALPLPGMAQEEPAAMSQQQEERFRPPPGAGNLEAIVHRDAFFAGPFISVTNARPDLNLGWDARSIRVRSGEWQICTGRNYTGRCTTIDRDQPSLSSQFRSIASMRPTGGWDTGVGQSLRGAASEFFPSPLRNGQRIECRGGSSSCARSEANSFCRSMGWIMARSQGIESTGGRSFVADVLCARSLF